MLNNAADAIEEQAARIDELSELADANIIRVTNDEIELLRARIAELEEALKPFADDASSFDGFTDGWEIDPLSNLTVGDLRAARAAMEGKDD